MTFQNKTALFTLIFSAIYLFSPLGAHQPSAVEREKKFIVGKAVLNLHEECSEESRFVSQGIYGHVVCLVEEKGDGWALLETEDGYRGYALVKGLIADNPRWRASRRLVKVSSLAGMVYPIADIEGPALLRLPYGSRVELLRDYGSNSDRWLEVQLADGKRAFMQRGDLEKPRIRSIDEVVELAHQFLGLPYIWGGSSSEGFDCSGFIQMLFKEMGVLLPRDSRPQAALEKVYPIEKPERAGDLLFFGEEEITHVGLYIGDGRFIHSGVRDNKPKVAIAKIGESSYSLLAVRRVKEVGYRATISHLSHDICAKMAYSWREDNPVPLSDLRYIALNHWGFDGCVHDGELIAHKAVAEEIAEIFRELFAERYPIEKMLLIDSYLADDDSSCSDNNTSIFCSRPITGSTSQWSLHSYGLAIDVNPLLNPYYKRAYREHGIIGEEFLDRTLDCYGLIAEEDLCYRAFTSRGWKWGGHWAVTMGCVDYQHFYKEIP